MNKPEDIRYDKTGVWIGDAFFSSSNPKSVFAKLLAAIPDDSFFLTRRGNTLIRSSTIMSLPQRIGSGCIIGGDGFRYERNADGSLFEIPHRGNVIIEAGVVIHNNVCIDRAVTGSTIIGSGTKIDNLVHIAHGVRIGQHCLIVAGAVIGGSAVIGDNCFIGINASIRNKVKIGHGVTIGMGAVVTKDVPDHVTVIGNPARIQAP